MASGSEHAQMLSRARARTSVFKQTSLLKHKEVAVVLTEIIARRDTEQALCKNTVVMACFLATKLNNDLLKSAT
jgi:hypothetical protein